MKKDDFIEIKRGIYIRKDDKDFYIKCARYGLNSYRHYIKIAENFEQQNELEKALEFYKKANELKSSVIISNKIKKIEEQIKLKNKEQFNTKQSKDNTLLYVLFINLSIILILLLLLFSNKDFNMLIDKLINRKTNIYTVYGTFDKVHKVINLPTKKKNEVIDIMIKEAKQLRQEYLNSDILIEGYYMNKKIISLEWNKGKEPNFEMYFWVQPQKEDSLKINKNVLEGKLALNNIINALKEYKKDKGTYPNNLEELVKDYPNNYLSFIPKEPITNSNKIYNTNNNKGGWVYIPPFNDDNNLLDNVYPNIKDKYIVFKEVKLILNDTTLYLIGDNNILSYFPVGIGKNNLFTPNKKYFIIEKGEPNDKKYGNLLLELSENNIAIHSTFNVNDLNKKISNGCVRVYYKDMEKLYFNIPKGTEFQYMPNFNLDDYNKNIIDLKYEKNITINEKFYKDKSWRN